MTSADDMADFFALCERSNFRSRDEILDGIRSDKYELIRHTSETGVPAASMLETYRRRSKHVGQFAERSSHANRMVNDIDAYVRELENATDDIIQLWSVTVDRTFSFSIFEGTVAGKILGCLYTADRRTVTSEEWDALWGHEQ
jgi:hypothetical protein